MSTNFDEVTLTAYALGELPADGVAEVEAYLRDRADARQLVDDVRATAARVTSELAAELAATPVVPRAVQLGGPPSMPIRARGPWAKVVIGLAAATAVAAGLARYLQASHESPPQLAVAPPVFNNPRYIDRQIPAATASSHAISALPESSAPLTIVKTQSGDQSQKRALAVNISSFTPPHEEQYLRDREHTISGLIDDARHHAEDGKFKESLTVVENIKRLDPHNAYAQGVEPFLADKVFLSDQKTQGLSSQLHARFGNEKTANLNGSDEFGTAAVRGSIAAKPAERTIPYEDIIRYSGDWPTLSSIRDRETSAGQDESQEPLRLQLDRRLPELRFNGNPLSGVVDFLRVVSGANIVVDWDALNKAGVRKETPITVKLTDVRFDDALTLILKSADKQHADTQVGYKCENGAVSISVGPTYSLVPPSIAGEAYNRIVDNPFLTSRQNPLSTFAVDVDTASYANVRRYLSQGQLPPADAVRVEELINYFPYTYPGPKSADAAPIAVSVEVAECPWAPAHRLARVALKAKSVAAHDRPPSNLVFLIDVSGSMADANKLPLLKSALKKLVGRLSDTDHVAIVTYAGSATAALPSTPCSDEALAATPEEEIANQTAIAKMWKEVYEPRISLKNGEPVNRKEVTDDFDKAVAELPKKRVTGRDRIVSAIDALNADGGTNGGDGIQMAYRTAAEHFLKSGVNRVVLATDGDFNVGVTNPDDLVRLIEDKSQSDVYLTVLGLGMGNVKDSTMEKLASRGKGNYAYLDSLNEADKVLGRQVDATLVTVAKDVKLQIEFNPATVESYRLIGYEHRAMPKEDFNDDEKTAGEMGAGHAVTALYEIIPAALVSVQPVQLKYQSTPPAPPANPAGDELMTVNVRYQPPEGGDSRKIEVPVQDHPETLNDTTSDFRFASAVAAFGMILRDSPYRGSASFDQVQTWAAGSRGEDVGGYRAQFLELVKRAAALKKP